MKKFAITALVVAVPLCAAAQSIEFQRVGDIAWACGGVGSSERADLDALRPQAQLDLLFVTERRGAFTAGTHVFLAPANGGTPVEFIANGPTCLVQAPPGSYKIEAIFEGTTRNVRANAAAKGRPTRVVISFPYHEPDDAIRATEEERRQAAGR
jgi:hypothetical protein